MKLQLAAKAYKAGASRPGRKAGARIETLLCSVNFRANFVAPVARPGRGLKLRYEIKPAEPRDVAPVARPGRGLKLGLSVGRGL